MEKLVRHSIFCVFVLSFLCVSGCNKDEPVVYDIPAGATPFTPEEEAFLPPSGGDLLYKQAPSFTNELTFEFQDDSLHQNAYAWREIRYRYSTDYSFRVNFRLRYYLSEDAPEKTLAIYLPYEEINGAVGKVLFETPIDSVGLSTGFFQDKVTYHNEIELEGTVYANVFEILPLTLDNGDIGTDTYFNKVYYNRSEGLIQLNQKNGNVWILNP